MSIHAIITLVSDAATLGSLRDFVKQSNKFEIPLSTELLEGAHAHIANDSAIMDTHGTTLESLSKWLEDNSHLPDITEVTYGDEVAVDAVVFQVEEISCGEHIPPDEGTGVLVTVAQKCLNH